MTFSVKDTLTYIIAKICFEHSVGGFALHFQIILKGEILAPLAVLLKLRYILRQI